MKLKTGQKCAFGFGAFGKDIVYMLISSYLLYYYNVVLGMSSVFIGTVMMAARIFDAFNDPVMGIIVAKTRTRWGRFRPWIFAGTVLNAVTIYALYATPESMGDSAQRVWLTVFYFAWGITYTLMDIPFWSMIPAITEPGSDREQLTSLARTCSGIGDAIPTVLTMTVVPILGAGSSMADYRIGFKLWALIIAVVFVISELVCVACVPERPVACDEKPGKISDMFKALFKNDQAMTVVVSIILVYTSLNICGNLVLYFFRFDVGNEGAYSIFAAVAFAAQVLVMMVIPLLRKKFSKSQLFISGFIIQIAGFAVILIMAFAKLYTPQSWYILCLPGILIYLGYGMLNVIMTIFLSDSVDYGEVMNGTREESVIFSMQTFTVKLASGVAVFLAGQVLGVHDLGHDGRTGGAARQLEQIQTLTAHTLKRVGGGAGLERTAAQQGSACRLYPLGAVGDLLLAFNAARPGDDCKVAAADLDAFHVDNAVVRVELAVGLLIRLGHAAAGLHHRVCQHPALRNGLGIADQTQNMGIAALGIVDLQPHIFQLVAEFAYLYVGCILFEYDDHSALSPLPYRVKRRGRPAPLPQLAVSNFSALKCVTL